MTYVEFGDSNQDQQYRWGRPFAEGWHDATVIEVLETSTRSGSAMIEVTLGITPGGPEGGVRVMDRLVMTPRAYWRVETTLAALAPDIIAELKRLRAGGEAGAEVDFSALVGRSARVLVETEVYDGKSRPKVKEYRPASPAQVKPLADAEDSDDIPF